MSKRKILEKFAELLLAFDWTYEYSDDHQVYLNGQQQRQTINQFLIDNEQYNTELRAMFDEANPFNNNKSII